MPAQSLPEPFISIIIATFNAENEIKRCLESITFQTYNNYEIRSDWMDLQAISISALAATSKWANLSSCVYPW